MKYYYLILVCLFLGFNTFADNVKELIERIAVTAIPFECIKGISYPDPTYAFPIENTDLPLATYDDLGLVLKNTIPSTDFVIFRRFCLGLSGFDVIALDISVSEWDKKLLTVCHGNEVTDYIEAEVSWYPNDSFFVKQWRITSTEEIIVTWLKVRSSSPISAFSDFSSVNAQRIDMHYRIDEHGKFQLMKEVKYIPRNYTRAYLTDKTKNLWEGDETPLEE